MTLQTTENHLLTKPLSRIFFQVSNELIVRLSANKVQPVSWLSVRTLLLVEYSLATSLSLPSFLGWIPGLPVLGVLPVN